MGLEVSGLGNQGGVGLSRVQGVGRAKVKELESLEEKVKELEACDRQLSGKRNLIYLGGLMFCEPYISQYSLSSRIIQTTI